MRTKKKKIMPKIMEKVLGQVVPPWDHSMREIHLREHSALSQFLRNEANKAHLDEIRITHRLAVEIYKKGVGINMLDVINEAAARINLMLIHYKDTGNVSFQTADDAEFFKRFFDVLHVMRRNITLNEYTRIVHKVNADIKAENERTKENKGCETL